MAGDWSQRMIADDILLNDRTPTNRQRRAARSALANVVPPQPTHSGLADDDGPDPLEEAFHFVVLVTGHRDCASWVARRRETDGQAGPEVYEVHCNRCDVRCGTVDWGSDDAPAVVL